LLAALWHLQQWKELLENVQRKEKKLREQATSKAH
jgi:hypothetical protein